MRAELGTGEPAGPELLPSAVALVWRSLVVWLLVILLVTVANIVP
jgi:adenosylcobinamide-phosphate synthase